MTRKQDTAKRSNWKELLAEQEDFLRSLIQEVVQQVLEAEMDEALGAGKGERTASRQGYRSGYYGEESRCDSRLCFVRPRLVTKT